MKPKTDREKILEIQSLGFIPFLKMKGKPMKIKSFDIQNDSIFFIMESKFSETYDYDVKPKELDSFLENFQFKNVKESAQNKNSKVPSTISDIRDVLFDTLKKLQDDNIEVDRAKAISGVSQTILNSAKVEMEYRRSAGIKKEINLLEGNKDESEKK